MDIRTIKRGDILKVTFKTLRGNVITEVAVSAIGERTTCPEGRLGRHVSWTRVKDVSGFNGSYGECWVYDVPHRFGVISWERKGISKAGSVMSDGHGFYSKAMGYGKS